MADENAARSIELLVNSSGSGRRRGRSPSPQLSPARDSDDRVPDQGDQGDDNQSPAAKRRRVDQDETREEEEGGGNDNSDEKEPAPPPAAQPIIHTVFPASALRFRLSRRYVIPPPPQAPPSPEPASPRFDDEGEAIEAAAVEAEGGAEQEQEQQPAEVEAEGDANEAVENAEAESAGPEPEPEPQVAMETEAEAEAEPGAEAEAEEAKAESYFEGEAEEVSEAEAEAEGRQSPLPQSPPRPRTPPPQRPRGRGRGRGRGGRGGRGRGGRGQGHDEMRIPLLQEGGAVVGIDYAQMGLPDIPLPPKHVETKSYNFDAWDDEDRRRVAEEDPVAERKRLMAIEHAEPTKYTCDPDWCFWCLCEDQTIDATGEESRMQAIDDYLQEQWPVVDKHRLMRTAQEKYNTTLRWFIADPANQRPWMMSTIYKHFTEHDQRGIFHMEEDLSNLNSVAAFIGGKRLFLEDPATGERSIDGGNLRILGQVLGWRRSLLADIRSYRSAGAS